MSRRSFCQACSNSKFGVRTRISVPHTCDRREKVTEDISEYPIIDGHREHYIHYPALRTNGKWSAVDVLLPTGHKGINNPARKEFATFDAYMKACNIHNGFHGWDDMDVKRIVSQSMGI